MTTIIGRDNKSIQIVLNDPSNPNSDVTVGKYGVTVSVGPASETKRTLANEQMMAFVNALPETASVVMDLVAEAQDWPKSGEFAERFRMLLPPGTIPEEDMTPAMKNMQAQNQKMQEMQAQIEQANAQADLAVKQAKASNDEARARLAEAQAYKAILDAQSRAADVEGKNDDREFQKVMGALDQHNKLEGEDRDFDLRQSESQSRMNGEQGNDGSSE